MASLLRAVSKQGTAPDYVRRLLAAVSQTGDSTPASQELIEPLSARELDVLRLLGTDLDGPEIARELVVSLNTVRTHTRNIYAKLGVNNRRAAVRRAQELGLSRRGGRQSRRVDRSAARRHRPRPVRCSVAGESRFAEVGAHRTRFTGRMATAPMMALTPATPYSTP